MAKLYFSYSAMNAGKSAILLQASHNYRERGMDTFLLTAGIDKRAGEHVILSRLGLSADAQGFYQDTDIGALIRAAHTATPLSCVLVDEAQFLTDEQVWQLACIADDESIPVMCYGLRTDFKGILFPGSAALLALADHVREIRTICHCGRKATMVVRLDDAGDVITDGQQIKIGGNESYVSLCRRHWREKMAPTIA